MALRAAERSLITNSINGAAKITELDRMAVANLDDRFLAVNLLDEDGNPATAEAKAERRLKFINLFRDLRTAEHVRALVNLLNPGYDGEALTESPDSDYTAIERNSLLSTAERLADSHTGFSVTNHAPRAVRRAKLLLNMRNNISSVASPADWRNFIRQIL